MSRQKRKNISIQDQIKADIKKFKRLAGGFKLGGDLSPEKINQIIDDSYAKDVFANNIIKPIIHE